MVGHVMICRWSGLAVVILLPIRVPVAREASFRRNSFMELEVLRSVLRVSFQDQLSMGVPMLKDLF